MNCEQLRAAAYGYFEGLLSETQRAEFEAHHAACPPCDERVTAAKQLNCQQFSEFLASYFDGDLAVDRKAIFERHIELCPPCGDYLKAYEQTVHLGREVCCEGEALPPDVPDQLVEAILEARKREC